MSSSLTRRSLLKTLGVVPFLFRPAPFYGFPLSFGLPPFDISYTRISPQYPAPSPLEDVLRLVNPGSDGYRTEKYAIEIEAFLRRWSVSLKASGDARLLISEWVDVGVLATPLASARATILRNHQGLECSRMHFSNELTEGSERFHHQLAAWLGRWEHIHTADFDVTAIAVVSDAPLTVRTEIRFDLAGEQSPDTQQEWVGLWTLELRRGDAGAWKIHKWEAQEETRAVVKGKAFVDVTTHALGRVDSFQQQLLRGADEWRTILDAASGIDVYGNQGVAAGDYDNDGFDDLYICQPSGLPNRLYRNRGDGTFEDVTQKAGVGVLDGTACALFADFDNRGLQDLLVVCGTGPVLFRNQGDGTFLMKRDAFRFEQPPAGTFTHAALADYDGDGRLDVYFCLYSYYAGLDQYHYPVPYYDARNGPPNFLFHNEGGGSFVDKTSAAGLHQDNDRYSFACSWGRAEDSRGPDLYVANDFGRANLYLNNGDGTFRISASDSHVEDPGAGMSAAWCDVSNHGRLDIYAANMWSAAGQRVAEQKQFQQNAPEEVRAFYRRHARGNSLYRNRGGGRFENVSRAAGVEMGRWSWCSDFWDFDHDGYADLYVANGYITSPTGGDDLSSFFWRQVVARSPQDGTPSPGYERGWNALNELIRSDGTWSGHERNVLFANHGDGTFTEASGAIGLDFPEDGRSFALADLDHDGRLEVILKNRNAPQLRILHNVMGAIGSSVMFRLRGTRSNRDAIGAAVTLEAGDTRQTRYLQAGSGFLAQHSKVLHFGTGGHPGPVRATIQWPGGLVQHFSEIPLNHEVAIVEGVATFSAKPFAASPPIWEKEASGTNPRLVSEPIETWLVQPLKAPAFALPDLSGATRELRSFAGKFVVLHLWTLGGSRAEEQLQRLERRHAALSAKQVEIVALNVDSDDGAAKVLASKLRLPYPVLFATSEVAGVYNILFRYLFDRRRDLPLPTTFLLDRAGMMVKVYQGPAEFDDLLQDVQSIAVTPEARLRKALPWPGLVYEATFQRNDFTYGVALFQHGYLAQAEESFQQVVTARPDYAEGYYNLGTLSLRRNDYPRARDYLDKALQLRADYPEAWNNLGMMAAQEGRPQEAVQNFERSLSLRPNYGTAMLNLGNVYRRQKAYAQAEEWLQKALTAQPDDPEVLYSLGMLAAQQNQMQSAAGYLQQSLALRPDYPEALNNLGVLHVHNQDYAAAEQQFQRSIRVAPAFDQAYFNLARLYVLRGEKDKAQQVLNDLLHLQPDNATARQALKMLE